MQSGDLPRYANIAAMISLLVSVVLLCLATAFGIADLTFTMAEPGHQDLLSRQVGYLYAPNWSFVSIVVFPLSIYLVCHASHDLCMIPDNLLAQRMLGVLVLPPRHQDGTSPHFLELVKDADPLYLEWRRSILETIRWIFLVSLIVCCSYAYYDYNHSVLRPLLENADFRQVIPTCPLPGISPEIDWSVAHLIDPDRFTLIGSAVFSLAAYTIIPGLMTGVVGGFFFAVAALGFRLAYVDRDGRYVLLPSILSLSRLGGLEIFRPLLLKSLLLIFLGFLAGYAVLVQNYYLRACDSNIGDFLIPGNWRDPGQLSSIDGIINLIGSLISNSFATPEMNLKCLVIIIVMFVLKLACVGLFIALVIIAARAGRRRVRSLLKRSPPPWLAPLAENDQHASADTQRLNEILDGNEYWPIGRESIVPMSDSKSSRYFTCTVNTIWFGTLSCLILMVFYRLAIVLFIVVIILAGKEILERFLKFCFRE